VIANEAPRSKLRGILAKANKGIVRVNEGDVFLKQEFPG